MNYYNPFQRNAFGRMGLNRPFFILGLCNKGFDNFKAKLYSVFGIKTLQGFETLEELRRNAKFNLVLKVKFFIYQPFYTTPNNLLFSPNFIGGYSYLTLSGRLSNGEKKSFIFLYCKVQKKKDSYVRKTP